MFLIVIFCALIGANEGTRVVNGTDATVEEFPFIVNKFGEFGEF